MALSQPSISFADHFANLPDRRLKRKQLHKLGDVVFVSFCAVIAGCNEFTEMEIYGKEKLQWLRRFVALENGIPSHDTFGRVFRMIDPKAFLDCFLGWVNTLHIALGGKIVAIDGKTARASLDGATGKKALHVVSAWVSENNLLIGQVATEEKSNEITAIPKLLEMLELFGAIVTADAMACQKEIVEKIRERGADYVLPAKGNQPKLEEAIMNEFAKLDEADAVEATCKIHETEEKGHGREDYRRYETMNVPADFPNKDEWRDLTSIGRATRVYVEKGETKTDVRYYIVSFAANARKFARAVRGEWGVENGLHWMLDVEFDEDLSRARMGDSQENLALLRRWVLSMLRQDTTMKGSIKSKRHRAGWNNETLEKLLGL